MNNQKKKQRLKSLCNKAKLIPLDALRFVLPIGTFLICVLTVSFINYIISIKSFENVEMLLNIVVLIIGHQLIDYLISYEKLKLDEELTPHQEKILEYKTATYKYYVTVFYVSALLANMFVHTTYYSFLLAKANELLSLLNSNPTIFKVIIIFINFFIPIPLLSIQLKINLLFKHIIIAFLITLIIIALTHLIRDFYIKQQNQKK